MGAPRRSTTRHGPLSRRASPTLESTGRLPTTSSVSSMAPQQASARSLQSPRSQSPRLSLLLRPWTAPSALRGWLDTALTRHYPRTCCALTLKVAKTSRLKGSTLPEGTSTTGVPSPLSCLGQSVVMARAHASSLVVAQRMVIFSPQRQSLGAKATAVLLPSGTLASCMLAHHSPSQAATATGTAIIGSEILVARMSVLVYGRRPRTRLVPTPRLMSCSRRLGPPQSSTLSAAARSSTMFL